MDRKLVLVVLLAALSLSALPKAFAGNITNLVAARGVQGKPFEAVGIIAFFAAIGAGTGVMLAGPTASALAYTWLFCLPMIFTGASAIAVHFVISPVPGAYPGARWLSARRAVVGMARGLAGGLQQGPGLGLDLGQGRRSAGGRSRAGFLLGPSGATVRGSAGGRADDAAVRGVDQQPGRLAQEHQPVRALRPRTAVRADTRLDWLRFRAGVTESGLILLPLTVAMFFSGLISGKLAHWTSGRTMIALGLMIGMGSVAVLVLAHGEKRQLCVATGPLARVSGSSSPPCSASPSPRCRRTRPVSPEA
jgi:hypothetical protein